MQVELLPPSLSRTRKPLGMPTAGQLQCWRRTRRSVCSQRGGSWIGTSGIAMQEVSPPRPSCLGMKQSVSIRRIPRTSGMKIVPEEAVAPHSPLKWPHELRISPTEPMKKGFARPAQ